MRAISEKGRVPDLATFLRQGGSTEDLDRQERKEGQEELALLRQMINPRQLKREIYDSLHRILMLPNATSGVTDAASVCIRPCVLLQSHRKEEAAQ